MKRHRLPRELRFRINSLAYYRVKLLPNLTGNRNAYLLEKARLTIFAAELLASGCTEAEVAERLRSRPMERGSMLRKLLAAVREME